MIRVSYEGIADLVECFLTPQFKLYSLVVAAGERALVTLLMSSRHAAGQLAFERKVSALMEPMGMTVSVVWFSQGTPGAEWLETRFSLFKNPWIWMALAASTALVVIAGWTGFFWTAFWGTSAWFIVRGLTFLLSRKKTFHLSKPKDTERR